MGPSPELFLAVWAIWLLVWLIAALRTSRTIVAQSPRSRLLHLALISLGAALVFFHFNTPAIQALQLLPTGPTFAWGSLLLASFGVGFAVWARIYLGRLWSGAVTLKEDHALIRSGPYGVTRRPIYTGLLAAMLGTAMANGTVAATLGFGLVTLACLLKVRLEEKVLRAHFVTLYDEYRNNVRALIPYIW